MSAPASASSMIIRILGRPWLTWRAARTTPLTVGPAVGLGALDMNQSKSKLGFNGAWSMAVGGMVGGGIF